MQQLLKTLLVACGLLATLAEASASRLSSSTCTIERLSVPIVQQSWRRLRGGEEADGEDQGGNHTQLLSVEAKAVERPRG
jgi:hypothetical protein